MKTYQIWSVVILCTAGLITVATRKEPGDMEIHHNLQIMLRVPDTQNEWWIIDDEDPDGFLYRGCNDFPNDKIIQPGYVAKYARWREKGDCKSIRGVMNTLELGFFYYHKNAKMDDVTLQDWDDEANRLKIILMNH